MNGTALFMLTPFLLAAEPQAEAKSDTTRSTRADHLEAMKEAASRYHFRHDAGEGATRLIAEPLLRWSNPVAQEEDAGLFLWTRQGRPVAAAQFFVRKNVWMHEFQSLSEGPFRVDWEGRTVWESGRAGVVFRPVPGGEPPAGSPVRRLRQMRAVAESFRTSVEFQYDGESHYELRLLPRPLHRYGPAEGRGRWHTLGVRARDQSRSPPAGRGASRGRFLAGLALRRRGHDLLSRGSDAQREIGLEG